MTDKPNREEIGNKPDSRGILVKQKLTEEDFASFETREELLRIISDKNINLSKVESYLNYEKELKTLQGQLVKLQQWVKQHRKKIMIIFEGRDASGKGGAIRRFKEHLNPRSMRIVALNKPTETEKGQWYFRRYVKELPNPGEIVFFDRSWYNRAVVEPVMGFCTDSEYNKFLFQVPEYEHMLYEDDVVIIKFWFSISKEEQLKRFESRRKNPLKQWKLSPVDEKSQSLWEKYTHYKEEMFSKTHNSFSPWIIVQANDKKKARLETIRYVLSQFDYDGKGDCNCVLAPDPNIITRYYRSIHRLD